MNNLLKLAHFAISAVKVVVDFFRNNEEAIVTAAAAAEKYAEADKEQTEESAESVKEESKASKTCKKAASLFSKIARGGVEFAKTFGEHIDGFHGDLSARQAA